ncbi:TPR and ankyrin repeat-containing protein 1-like isoform X2 [Mangifera indica]|uniref:TPR and ankyrin repeat-containing protein 1-like isoform X2 n=1 Tax=Mangifera indica TaxID=29780 RepID=UPI001CFA48B8|nr:TPR and ankyrin repeat-containing protein 1-like isoform X2 [Mangifera indica]
MKEQNLLDSTSPRSFPSFNEAKHNILCAELKQLYVAITRTSQRLWIWEDNEDVSKPMFDYWKRKFLVQLKQLDDSFVHAMQVVSTPEEWKLKGLELFHECNYEMATFCFERAKDFYWEERCKATALKADADRIRSLNPVEANIKLRQAAIKFEAISNADSAAKCFYESGEYERAEALIENADDEKSILLNAPAVENRSTKGKATEAGSEEKLDKDSKEALQVHLASGSQWPENSEKTESKVKGKKKPKRKNKRNEFWQQKDTQMMMKFNHDSTLYNKKFNELSPGGR